MDPGSPDVLHLGRDFARAVAVARAHLAAGGVVVAPTETFYGLLARADADFAVARVLACKGRPPDKPLPLVVADAAAARRAGTVSEPMARLMAAFWPGPLTLVLPARQTFAPACCGTDAAGTTLAVRASSSPFVAALARALGVPLTATSANLSGAPAARSLPEVVLQQTDGCLAVDGGTTAGGLPSTLVRHGVDGLELLRAGAVPWACLQDVWAQAGGAPLPTG